jgi:hypothetical protein
LSTDILSTGILPKDIFSTFYGHIIYETL